MSEPAVLVPSGLAKVHPQLETSIKSIAGAIRSLQATKAAGTASGGANVGLAAQVAALEAQLAALKAEMASIPRGRGFAFFA